MSLIQGMFHEPITIHRGNVVKSRGKGRGFGRDGVHQASELDRADIFGLSNLEVPSMVSTVSFMAAGLVTTNLIYRVIL